MEDEAANRTMLHDLTERERQFEDSREILQTKLNELRLEKGEVSMSLDQTLRKLENELNEIQRVSRRLYFSNYNPYHCYNSTHYHIHIAQCN